ncbi:MAG: bifunctional UDP-N-acetylglucosamine diphosphorylase/glucosamine-1-phosphate N-acetyltransferase GlmU [Thiobacillaceae bacterium]|nr:bifunctional UDP-N-acetylglucosamine diphosphorylase/glucosamine-1-phosphate N-acetyltransferase GlmU [Thiobacillaceae bacterium]
MSELDVVVMAAGKGTRMKSGLPKVLHRLAGRTLIDHVLRSARALSPRKLVVVTGFAAQQVEAALPGDGVIPVRQSPQLGTGHAVQQAAPHLPDDGLALILNGDVPLLRADTLSRLVQAAAHDRLALLTLTVADASGYGRILRADDGQIRGIVEDRDASPAQKAIREFYTGVMCAPTALLKRWLARLDNRNAQGEYYLTDVVAMAVADGVQVLAAHPDSEIEVAGVNSPTQLAELERALQLERARQLMDAGVRLADPARIDIRGELQCGQDVEIDVNCVFEGHVELGDRVRIGPHCVIADARIAPGAEIAAFTHIAGGADRVEVGEGARVGPFARLRPGARLGRDVHVGNFVEVKNATLAEGAKANHLAYLGDATVGERVNYGAGAITANYDGANKHRTVIEDEAFIGSDSQLVAPVTVGRGATLGAGTTLTRDAPPGELTLSRVRQFIIPGWQRPKKKGEE